MKNAPGRPNVVRLRGLTNVDVVNDGGTTGPWRPNLIGRHFSAPRLPEPIGTPVIKRLIDGIPAQPKTVI